MSTRNNAEEHDSTAGEQQFLLDLCRSYADPQCHPPQEIRLAPGASWALIFELAIQHRLLLLVANYLLSHAANQKAPPFARRNLWEHVEINRHRHEHHVKVTKEVQLALERAGIRSAARKGVVYASLLFGESALRTYGDIDMYVAPEHSKQVSALLEELGFTHGTVDRSYSRIAEFNRADLLMQALFYPDHLLRFIKMLDDKFVRTVSVDFSLDIAWTEAPANPARHDWLKRILTAAVVDRNSIFTLPTYLHFFDCAVNIYRDAFFEREIRTGRDVDLAKFLDLLLLWQHMPIEDHTKLLRDVHSLGMAGVLAWSLHHLDQVFEVSLLDRLELRDALRNENSWQSGTGQIKPWRGTMRQRLFSKSRRELFVGLSARQK